MKYLLQLICGFVFKNDYDAEASKEEDYMSSWTGMTNDERNWLG